MGHDELLQVEGFVNVRGHVKRSVDPPNLGISGGEKETDKVQKSPPTVLWPKMK